MQEAGGGMEEEGEGLRGCRKHRAPQAVSTHRHPAPSIHCLPALLAYA